MSFLSFISSRKTGNILALLIIAAFLISGLVRLYPYENNLQESLERDPGDDWWTYARNALDIRYNGILMPSVSAPYPGPGSFLYIYFIALSFLLFGENLIPIFIIQHLMLGLSVAIMYWTFRDKLRSLTGIIFLGALALFTLLDVHKYYVMRLLGENLIFLTMPLFFLCFMRGFERDSIGLQMTSAFLIGAVILMRANIVILAFLLILIVAPFYFKRRPAGIAHLFIFITLVGLSPLILGIRNYLLAGKWQFLPTGGISSLNFIYFAYPIRSLPRMDLGISGILEYICQNFALLTGHLGKKILFSFGFLPLLDSAYRFRPHWMIMWSGYFVYLYIFFRRRWKMEIWELATHLYILVYYGSLIIAAQIHNYGFRMLIPATNFVLLFSFLAFDKFSRKEP